MADDVDERRAAPGKDSRGPDWATRRRKARSARHDMLARMIEAWCCGSSWSAWRPRRGHWLLMVRLPRAEDDVSPASVPRRPPGSAPSSSDTVALARLARGGGAGPAPGLPAGPAPWPAADGAHAPGPGWPASPTDGHAAAGREPSTAHAAGEPTPAPAVVPAAVPSDSRRGSSSGWALATQPGRCSGKRPRLPAARCASRQVTPSGPTSAPCSVRRAGPAGRPRRGGHPGPARAGGR